MLRSRTTRLIAGAVGLAVAAALLSGCGGNSSASEDDTKANADAFPRTVSHAMGETVIPKQPVRVVALDTGELDNALALGATVVGAGRTPVAEGFLEYVKSKAGGVTIIGTVTEPNLEQITAVKPDLILGSKTRAEKFYGQLSKIAPTVFTDDVGVPWKDIFRKHAEALGKDDKATEMLKAWDKKVAGVRTGIEKAGSPTVSVTRFLPGKTRLYQKASFIGDVLEEAGVKRPASQDVEAFSADISPEQIAKADADVIFVTVYGPEDKTTKQAISTSPLWQNLNAVKAGRVETVSDDVWIAGLGIQAANLILDDLDAKLVK